MKGKGKGISSSALPYKRRAPRWVTISSSALVEMIVKQAKKGRRMNEYIIDRYDCKLNWCLLKRLIRYSLGKIFDWKETHESIEKEW